MKRRRLLAATTGLVAAGSAGCLDALTANGRGSDDRDYDVGMTLNEFTPSRLEVPAGTTVVWRNTSSRAHTVTAYEAKIPDDADYFASGSFLSEEAARQGWDDSFGGSLDSGDEYEHTFETPGSYTYFCIPHEAGGMAATVDVTE